MQTKPETKACFFKGCKRLYFAHLKLIYDVLISILTFKDKEKIIHIFVTVEYTQKR